MLGMWVYVFWEGFLMMMTWEFIMWIWVSLVSWADSALLFDSLKVLGREGEFRKNKWKLQTINGIWESAASVAGWLIASISIVLAWYVWFAIEILPLIVTLFLREPPIEKSAVTFSLWQLRGVFRSEVLESPIVRGSILAWGTILASTLIGLVAYSAIWGSFVSTACVVWVCNTRIQPITDRILIFFWPDYWAHMSEEAARIVSSNRRYFIHAHGSAYGILYVDVLSFIRIREDHDEPDNKWYCVSQLLRWVSCYCSISWMISRASDLHDILTDRVMGLVNFSFLMGAYGIVTDLLKRRTYVCQAPCLESEYLWIKITSKSGSFTNEDV